MLTTRVIFLGANGVGKTTLLYLLKMNTKITTIPTIGYNCEELEYKNRKIQIFDIGGHKKIRHLWHYYFNKTNCIIYMMDISDKEEFNCYIECFNILLEQHKDFRNIPIIIYGNQINDKTEFDIEEILQKINFPAEISPHILKGNILKEEARNE